MVSAALACVKLRFCGKEKAFGEPKAKSFLECMWPQPGDPNTL